MTLLMLETLFDRLVDLCAALAASLILFMMVSVSIDIVGRYFFNSPVGWVLDYAEYSLVYIPFLAMAWLVRKKGGHVAIDLLPSALSAKPQAILGTLTALIAGATCATAATWAGLTTWDHFTRGTMTIGIYPIPKYSLLAVVGFGFALTTIEFARTAAAAWRRRNDG